MVWRLGLQPLHGCGIFGAPAFPPRSRHRFARRQRRVIDIATARAVVRWVSYKCNGLMTIDINRGAIADLGRPVA